MGSVGVRGSPLPVLACQGCCALIDSRVVPTWIKSMHYINCGKGVDMRATFHLAMLCGLPPWGLASPQDGVYLQNC